MTSRHIVLCHPVRTAIGAYGGSLKDMAASDLGATAIRETLKRSGLAGSRVTTWSTWRRNSRTTASRPSSTPISAATA